MENKHEKSRSSKLVKVVEPRKLSKKAMKSTKGGFLVFQFKLVAVKTVG